jgi:TRAP-type mannitol/chloroaromatic compound transport system permease small subunit
LHGFHAGSAGRLDTNEAGGRSVVGALLRLSAAIDWVNTRIGLAVSWLVLLAVVISTVNAVMRKALDMSSNAWLEAQWQLFGAVFMLAAAWTLIRNEHIRIDIVNSALPKPVRNWIDLLGHFLFLMPFCLIMLIDGIPFFNASYRIGEMSANAGGLPQWTAKLLVPLGFFLLALQGISEIIKRIAIMRGAIPDPHEHHDEGHGLHSTPEAEEKAV